MELRLWGGERGIFSALLLSALIKLSSGLRCAVCRITRTASVDSVDIDRRRLVFGLPRPYCRHLDEVVCDRDMDACVTAITDMNSKGWWISMGCDFKKNHPNMEGGCDQIREDTRTVTFDKAHKSTGLGRRRITEDRTVLTRCICSTDYCNAGPREIPTSFHLSCLALFHLQFILLF